jgi:tetratricopeptide (TPR) repeat protein
MRCRYDEALDALEAAADLYRAGKDLEGLRRVTAAIGWAHGDRGTPEEGLSRLLALLAQQGEGAPSPGLTRMLAALACLYIYNARYAESLATAKRAASMAQGLGDEALLVHTGKSLTWALKFCGQEEEALQQLQATCRLAETIGAVGDVANLHEAAALICEIRGEFDRGKQLAAEGVRSAEQLGMLGTVGMNLTRLGAICFFSGDWEQARAHNARALSIVAQVADYYQTALLHAGQLNLAEGSWELAESYLQQSSSMSGKIKHFAVHKVVESHLAELEILVGRPEAAYARLLPLLDERETEELAVSTYVLPRLAWAALELGLVDQTAAMIAEALRRGRAHGYRLALLDMLRVQGMLLARTGQRAAAASTFEEGLSLARQIGCPYGEARLLHAYGQLHVEASDRGPTRERLEAALAIFRRLGARKDAEQAEQLLSTLS